jgi:hypothetical protein
MAVRHADPRPFTPPAAAMAAGRVGRCPGLVDEDEAFGVEIGLAVEPVPPALQDVRAVLLGGVRGLFFA